MNMTHWLAAGFFLLTSLQAIAQGEGLGALLSASAQFQGAGAGEAPLPSGPSADPRDRLAGPTPEVGGFVEPWQRWSRTPVAAPLILEVNTKAASGSAVTVSIAGQNFTVSDNVDCGIDSSTNRFYPALRPHNAYVLSLSGPTWAGAKIVFKGYTPRHLLSRRGIRAIPRPYKVFVNGEDLNENDALEMSFPCGNYTTNLLVEVRPDRGLRPMILRDYEENWSRDEDQDNAAPGDGQWPELGPGRSLTASDGAFRWSVSVGKLRNGFTAGRIRLNEERIGAHLFDATALSYFARSTNLSELHVITNGNGSLRQVRAPQALVDITSTTSPTQECVLNFYRLADVSSTTNANGLYAVLNNTPFVTWRIRNPDTPGSFNRFQIVEERPGPRTHTSEISFAGAPSPLWQLTYGVGAEQRIEKRLVSLSGNGRTETVEIRSPGTLLYTAVEKYSKFGWGSELTNVVTHPGTYGLTNSFVYFDDPNQRYAYGKLKERWYPGGRWELYRYPYFDEFGYPQCDEWPLGSYQDYYDAHVPAQGYGLPPDELGQIRIGPFQDAPATPSGITLSNVVFAECSRRMSGVAGRPTYWARQLVFDPAGVPTLVDWEAVADGDFDRADDIGWTASDSRWRGVAEAIAVRSFRFKQQEHWRHDLLRYQRLKTGEAHLFEYGWGTYDPNADPPWNPDPSGLDFAQLKTTGLDAGPLSASAYPDAFYEDYVPEDQNNPNKYLYCVVGKSTQQATIYRDGNPIRTDLLAMRGITNAAPEFKLIETRYRRFDSLGHLTNELWVDASNTNIYRTTYQASWQDPATGQDTELKAWEINELGERFEYTYDSLKRLASVTRKGVSAAGGFPAQADFQTNWVFNAAGWLTSETVSGVGSGLSLTRSVSYDLAGRVTQTTGFDGIVVTTVYSADARTTTETFPGGVTKITARYLDGRLKSVTGTGVVPEYHDYFVDYDADPFATGTLVERIHSGYSGSPRWREQAVGAQGKVLTERVPAFGGGEPLETVHSYWHGAWLSDEIPAYSVAPATVANGEVQSLWTKWQYDLYGLAVARQELEGQGSNSPDRKSAADTTLEHDGTHWWRVTRQWWDATPSTVRTNVIKERLTGFSSGTILSEGTITDPDGNITTFTNTIDQAAKKLITVTNTPQSTINITGVTINGLLQSLNSASVSTPAYFYYDALRRQTAIQDPLGFVSGTAYDPATGWVAAVTNANQQVTSFQYFAPSEKNAGKLKCRIDPNGKKTYYDYNDRGQPTRTWGDVPYPEERRYDPTYGDLTELWTYQTGTNWSSATWPGGAESPRKTTWTYDAATGLLLAKKDDANRGYTLNYLPTRVLWTKTWARGVTITNTFNAFGDLERKDYSDGTPSVVIGPFDSLGNPVQLQDAFGTVVFGYDDDGEPISATYQWDSPFFGLAITNRIHPLYGRDLLVLDSQIAGQQFQFRTEYGFDPATGRLQSVQTTHWTPTTGDGVTDTTAYTYWPNSDLVQTLATTYGATPVLTTSKTWDYGYRLRSVTSTQAASGPVLAAHTYDYDAVDRRTQTTRQDASAWHYLYNDRNELVQAVRAWLDATPVAGQQFEYAYDPAGNRTASKRGGDATGAGRLLTTSAVNNLDQYTALTNAGALDVIGAADLASTVTVNGQPCYQRGQYWWTSLPVANTSTPVWQGVTNTATAGGSVSVTGHLYAPPLQETLSYDADGNLLTDGRWNYTWDAENRLVRMETTLPAAAAGVPRVRLDLGYDGLGRRTSKTVLTGWNGTAYTLTNTTRFLYDLAAAPGPPGGWNLIAELNPDNTLIRAYAWGLDLSGALETQGNVGGLVELLDYATGPPGRYFPVSDGNGNVVALLSSGAAVVERYEWGPFGEAIRGPKATTRLNPLGWSSRYEDAETDLVYFGHRYYAPRLGRWLSRDPIEEADTLNLYGYVRNQPISAFDRLGLTTVIEINATSLLQASLRGGAIGASASSLANLLVRRAKGDWKDIGRAFLKGFATGAVTGSSGYLMKQFAGALVATGYRGEPTKMAGLLIGGFNAGIGFTAGTWIEGRSLSETLSTPEGRLGAAIAVGLGAAFGAGGVYAQEQDWWGGATLDFALKAAGAAGGVIAIEVYDAAETFREFVGNYREEISQAAE